MLKCLYLPWSKTVIIPARDAKKEQWIKIKEELKPNGIEVVGARNRELLKYAFKQCTKKPANSAPDATTTLTMQEIKDALNRLVSTGDWKEASLEQESTGEEV